MRSFGLRIDRQARYVIAAAILLLATIVPALASAAQVTTRSITLSSSSKAATGVSYTVDFTAISDAGAVVVEFCSNTPLLGETCSAPGGFSLSSATVSGGFTKDAVNSTANKLIVTGTIDVSTDDTISIPVAAVTNPTAAGPLYARIVTYTTDATGYTSADPDAGEDHIDDGGVAMYITETIGVTAAVLESMTFCVSKLEPTQNCGGTSAPTLELGEDVGGVVALSPSAVSTGDLYTQISTNAASGAIVRLKSNATSCGGLLRAGAPSACDIAPALTGGNITAGQAKFGVTAATSTDPTGSGTPSGLYRVASGSTYNASTYEFNYVAGNGTGVTSTYGDPFLDTNDAPITNKQMKLTFGASVSNTTPAGKYSTDLSMIATGKF